MGHLLPLGDREADMRDFDLIERGFFADPEEVELPTFFQAIDNPQLIERLSL